MIDLTFRMGDIRFYFPLGEMRGPRMVILRQRLKSEFSQLKSEFSQYQLWLLEDVLTGAIHEDVSWVYLGNEVFTEMEVLALSAQEPTE